MYVDNGEESYRIYYTYDANNRLTQERKYQNGTYTTIATYTYDDNGNLLTKTGADGTAAYTYNGFNQQTGYTVSTTTSAYAYNAKGIRTAKSVGAERTSFLLDGGNVVTEVKNNAVSANYIRGTNLISKEADNSTSYYLYNAHGDVIGLTNNTGSVTKTYDYDAFGIEKNPNTADTNPFRYCGEYYDTETGKYYLRARYCEPINGRFTQPDTHWNTANMIYGDNPQKTNEREDALGTALYSYKPQISAILQSGNLYVYGLNNPVAYTDPTGKSATLILAAASVPTVAVAASAGSGMVVDADPNTIVHCLFKSVK